MGYKLFLDDYRNPVDVKWISIPSGPYKVVRNYDEFVNTISELGIPEYVLDSADYILSIPMFGSVRSLNVSVSSGIIMYEYRRQHGG